MYSAHVIQCTIFVIDRLKWKPAHENTVDFKIFVKRINDQIEFHIGILVKHDNYQEFGQITLEPEMKKEYWFLSRWEESPPNGRIIECRYDPDWPNNWKFSRYRDDKLTSNHITVYDNIMKSIEDNVTEEEVFWVD